MKHLLTLRETAEADIRYLLDTADSLQEILARPVKKVPTLRGRAMITLFYENSTRTRTSFEMAAKIMSAEAINIAVAQSSVAKGESLKDTLLTLQALKADCIVMRHRASGAPQFAAEHLEYPDHQRGRRAARTSDAGPARHAHHPAAQGRTCRADRGDRRRHHAQPRRALQYLGPDQNGRERAAGRAAHAAAARRRPTACPGFRRSARGWKARTWSTCCVCKPSAGAGTAAQPARVLAVCSASKSHSLKAAKPDVLVLHPGPMNRGVEISADVADGAYGIRSAIEEQVTNGVAVRMAVLYMLMGDAGNDSRQESVIQENIV